MDHLSYDQCYVALISLSICVFFDAILLNSKTLSMLVLDAVNCHVISQHYLWEKNYTVVYEGVIFSRLHLWNPDILRALHSTIWLTTLHYTTLAQIGCHEMQTQTWFSVSLSYDKQADWFGKKHKSRLTERGFIRIQSISAVSWNSVSSMSCRRGNGWSSICVLTSHT